MKMANQEEENITVSKIYETLQSGPFLKYLYWDVLSDIKEKSSFKQLKETTHKLINKKTEALVNLSDSPADVLQRKKIVTEICSMTYTVDTVFSKIMFIKLQKEFKSHITDCIKDLRKEKKINDSVWSKLAHDPAMRSMSESSTSKNNASQQKTITETSSRPVRNKRTKLTPNEIAIKNYEIRSEIHKDLKAINSEEKRDTYMKKLRVKNHVSPEKKTETKPKGILKKKQNDEKLIPASSHLKNTKVKSKEKSCFENTEEVKITPEGKAESDEEGSDTDSIISVGHVSTASVSSVHTSDLSSFDDEISLSSDDELDCAKRRISLKELKQVCNGKLPEKLDSSILKDLTEVSMESSNKNTEAKSEQQSEEISKKRPVENNKSNKNQVEENLKRKTAENEKQQILESPKRKTVWSNKHQVEDKSKRKASENGDSQIEKSPKKLTTEINQSQIEESSMKKTTVDNKLPVESGSNKNSPAPNRRRTQSFQELLDSADSAAVLKLDSSKTLMKRIRKPNSKYSSDNILCTITKVKERKKQSVMNNEKQTSKIPQPNKKRTRKSSSDLDEKIPPKNSKIVPVSPEKNTKLEKDSKPEKDTNLEKDTKLETDSKPENDTNLEKDNNSEKDTKPEEDSKPENDTKVNLPIQSTPLEMFKPHFPVRSLTSRRTAPVTLFST